VEEVNGETSNEKKGLKQWYKRRFASHRTTGRLVLGFIAFLPISVIIFVMTGTLMIFGIIPSIALGCLIDVFVFGSKEDRKRGLRFLGESLVVGATIFHIFIWCVTGSFTIAKLDLGIVLVLLVVYLIFGALVVFPVWKLMSWLKQKTMKEQR